MGWLLTATNHGVEDAFGVTVQVELPDQVIVSHRRQLVSTFANVSINDDPGPGYDPATGIWRVGRLNGGSSKHYVIVTKLADGVVESDSDTLSVPGRAVISNAFPVEPPSLRHNNTSVGWTSATPLEAVGGARTGRITLEAFLDNPLPQDSDTINLTLTVSQRYPRGFVHGRDEKAYGLRTRIKLSPGLGTPTASPPTGTTFAIDQGRIWDWHMESHGPSGVTQIELSVPVTSGSEVAGNCITAELTVERPYDDPSDNTVRVCFQEYPPTLFQTGETDLFTVYPCVGVDTYPCTSSDTVEVVAVGGSETVNFGGSAAVSAGIGNSGAIMQPERTFIQVKDPQGRIVDDTTNSVNSGGAVSWRTGRDAFNAELYGVIFTLSLSEFNDELSDWDNVVHAMSVRGLSDADAVDQVCDAGDPSPPCAPGRMKIRNHPSRGGWSVNLGGSVFFDPNPTETKSPLSLSISRNPTMLFAEFEKLGTYVVEYTITATRTDTTTYPDGFTGTGTYTFHVGPIAELGVRDGGPVPLQLETGQRAFSVVAVNTGPDAALGARVDVSLPQGVTVVRAIPSVGTYNSGVWDIGGLQHKDYLRAAGKPEGETLALILNCPTEGCGKATATISNDNVNHPYQVVIDGVTHTGTVYDYIDGNNTATLRARPGTGGGGPGAPGTGTQKPRSVPAAIAVEWRPVPAVNGWAVSHYEVERWSSGWELLADDVTCPAGASCRYVDIDARTGRSYSYRVRAVNVPGVPGPWSRLMVISRSITAGAPEAPVLTAAANGRTEIELTWDKPIENGSSIISYTLEIADRGSGPWAVPDPAPQLDGEATSWTHHGLLGGTRKYYRLLATNSQGDSNWSDVVSAGTDAAVAPGAPVNLAATAEGDTVVLLSWEAPGDDGASPISSYEAQWSADVPGWSADTAQWTRVGSAVDGETLSLSHRGLTPGESIHYRVRARNSVGWGDWSATALAHPPAGVPGAPVLTAQGHRATEIRLSWNRPVDRGSQILRYALQVSEDGGSNWRRVDNNISADATEYIHGGLTDGATRHYRVRAVNENGPGGWSRVRSATTAARAPGPPGCPPDSVLDDLEEQFRRELACSSPPLLVAEAELIVAAWGSPADDGGLSISGYEVQYRRSGGGWQTWPHDGTHTSTWIFEHSDGSALTNGRTYQVRVRATNAKGAGRWVQASAVPQPNTERARRATQRGTHRR